MQRIRVSAGVAVLSYLVTGFAPVAIAQNSVPDFYKDKTVTITVGHQAGTGFDLYSRLLICYMGNHIPGKPAMQVNNMIGASGVVAANWLYNSAPRDGTVMGTFVYTVPLETVFASFRATRGPSTSRQPF